MHAINMYSRKLLMFLVLPLLVTATVLTLLFVAYDKYKDVCGVQTASVDASKVVTASASPTVEASASATATASATPVGSGLKRLRTATPSASPKESPTPTPED